MTDAQPRQYLDDVPIEIQDLIYENRSPEAAQRLMAHKGRGKMQAAIEVGRIASRMNAEFPGAVGDPISLSSTPSGSSSGPSPKVKTLLLWAFILLFGLAGTAAIVLGTRSVILAKASVEWPTTKGRILSSKVEKTSGTSSTSNRSRSGNSAHARIVYEYTVDGQTYTGKRVAYGHKGRPGAYSAGSIVKHYHKGRRVTISYKPGNPGECVLEPGLLLKAFTWPGAGVFMLLLTALIASAAVSVARDERREAEQAAGGHA